MEMGKVLLCTDFSQPAELLFDCLPEMRSYGLSEVVLYHAVNIRSAGGNAAELKEHNQKALEEKRESLEEEGFKVEVRVDIGFPPEEITKAAEEEEVSFILLGSIGKGLIRRMFMGSTTLDAMRLSAKPMLVEKYGELIRGKREAVCSLKFERILVPLDFSSASLEVLKKIGKILDGKGNIVLLAVIESSETAVEFKEERERITKKLEKLKEEWGEKGQKIHYHVQAGNAAESILEKAKEEEATMIALSKRGTGSIKDVLIGNTAETVALRSPVPILLFPN